MQDTQKVTLEQMQFTARKHEVQDHHIRVVTFIENINKSLTKGIAVQIAKLNPLSAKINGPEALLNYHHHAYTNASNPSQGPIEGRPPVRNDRGGYDIYETGAPACIIS